MLAAMSSFATSLGNIASYFSVPTLGGLYSEPKMDLGPFFGKLFDIFSVGMPVYPDSYEETGGNEIGEQVLVGGAENTVGALYKVMDNVVVNPRAWKIHGYIGINIESGRVSQIAATAGGLPILSSFVQTYGRDALNLVIKNYLRYVTEARRPFKFTTADGETIPALIESYSIKSDADNLNWVDVDLSIKEFRFVGLYDKGTQVVIGGYNSTENGGSWAKMLSRSALKTVGMRISRF